MTATRTGQVRGILAERADPQFAARLEEARWVFAESLESSEAGGFLQQFRKGHVVAGIVLAKRHDPANYIEGNLTLTASFSAELKQEDGQALLQAMFGLSTRASQQALGAGGGGLVHELPARPATEGAE
jgi:hypothetical protein